MPKDATHLELGSAVVEPIAQLNHQAYGSHAIIDRDFDHFDDEDIFIIGDHLNPIYEANYAL